MGEISFRMLPDILFQMFPVSLIVADFFAGGADGDETPERFDLGERLAKLIRGHSFHQEKHADFIDKKRDEKK